MVKYDQYIGQEKNCVGIIQNPSGRFRQSFKETDNIVPKIANSATDKTGKTRYVSSPELPQLLLEDIQDIFSDGQLAPFLDWSPVGFKSQTRYLIPVQGDDASRVDADEGITPHLLAAFN
jgi:hypothetical protein